MALRDVLHEKPCYYSSMYVNVHVHDITMISCWSGNCQALNNTWEQWDCWWSPKTKWSFCSIDQIPPQRSHSVSKALWNSPGIRDHQVSKQWLTQLSALRAKPEYTFNPSEKQEIIPCIHEHLLLGVSGLPINHDYSFFKWQTKPPDYLQKNQDVSH